MKGRSPWSRQGLVLPTLLVALLFHPAHASDGGGTVSTDKLCYEYDEDIKIRFEIMDPGEDDWIGIYPWGMVDGALEPTMWLWSCGTQGCWGKMDRGILTFGGGGVNVDYTDQWPLDNGRYRAVLARDPEDDSNSYDLYALSDVFEVKRFNSHCENNANPLAGTSSLTPRPTPVPTPPPTPSPTPVPTPPPTPYPTPSPTPSPTPKPTTAPPTEPATQNMAPVIAAAKQDIALLIWNQPTLAPLFLRMVFQDCIGGCDGCIHLGNPHNGLLDLAMDVLTDIVDKYEPYGLSRPDLWVLASFVGVELTMPADGFLAIPFKTIGRQTCGDDMKAGPNPTETCPHNLSTDDLLTFFRTNFGFSPQETAAIMGAHTIGVMHREVLGFDGMNGWTMDNDVFNNGYYKELVGPGTEQKSQVDRAPNWIQKFVDNRGLGDADVPNVFQWEGYPNGEKIVMLNADIALVRQLHNGNKAPSGKVACQFVSRGGTNTPCPMSRADLFQEVVRYRNDNQCFLEDFRDALTRMTQNGYSVDASSCDADGICRLIKV